MRKHISAGSAVCVEPVSIDASWLHAWPSWGVQPVARRQGPRCDQIAECTRLPSTVQVFTHGAGCNMRGCIPLLSSCASQNIGLPVLAGSNKTNSDSVSRRNKVTPASYGTVLALWAYGLPIEGAMRDEDFLLSVFFLV